MCQYFVNISNEVFSVSDSRQQIIDYYNTIRKEG